MKKIWYRTWPLFVAYVVWEIGIRGFARGVYEPWSVRGFGVSLTMIIACEFYYVYRTRRPA